MLAVEQLERGIISDKPALDFVNGTTPLFSLSEFCIVHRSVFLSLSMSAFRVVSVSVCQHFSSWSFAGPSW